MSVKNLLCLDFDGVICDSIEECLLVAYNSYMLAEGRSGELVEDTPSIPEEAIDKFYKYRYLVRPAKDYWILMDLILRRSNEITEEFKLVKAGNEKKLNEFEEIFFQTRTELQEDRFNFWIIKNKVYESFYQVWDDISSKYDVYIVTNKNRRAVEAILKFNNIEILESHLYSKERFDTKIDALNEIAKMNNKQKDEIVFVDDSPETIVETLNEFPKSFLANWGYFENNSDIQSINNLSEIL